MEVPPTIAAIFDKLDPPMRKRKLSNADALRQLCYVLKTGVPWRYVHVKECGFSAVYKRFQSWSSKGIIDKAWVELTSSYASRRLAADPKWFKDLFIDTTMVKNVGGIDGLGKNPTDRGRMATKMSVVVDNAMIPVCCEFFPANVNNAVTAVKTIDGICCDIRRDGRYSNIVIGDNGYVSRHIENALRSRNMRLLTPQKINCKYSTADKGRLKRRHKVENPFSRLDKFKKIHCIHENNLDIVWRRSTARY